jgi:putative hydrolase of the HAD superfamily
MIGPVKYRAVFFDAGETIVYPHPSFPELLSEVLRAQSHEVDPTAIREKLHLVADIFTTAASQGELWSTSPERSRAFWGRVYGRLLGELGVPYAGGMAAAITATFTDPGNYRLFPDVLPTLERLRSAGIRMGVISNFEEWLERLLESLGVTPFFDVRIISGVEGVEKPDRRIFEIAIERAGVRPEDCVYVGDSVSFDIEPAGSIGMFPVLVDRRGRVPDHPGARVTTLLDLPAAIGMAA